MYMSALIRQHIFSLEEGKLFTTRDLLMYGKRGTVDQTLHRLAKRGVIVRITRGVFMRETATGWRPSVEEVATAKARAFCKEICACGQNAGSHTGEAGQSDSAFTFFCSGSSSSFVYDRKRIYFKSVSPGRLKQPRALPSHKSESVLNFQPDPPSHLWRVESVSMIETLPSVF